MSKTIELTDAQYTTLESAAKAKGQSPNDLLAQLIEGLQKPEDALAHYDTDDWFRHLGVSDDEIEQIKREVREEAETDAITTPHPSPPPSPAPPPAPQTPSAP